MKLAIPTFHVFSPFNNLLDRLPDPDEWQLMLEHAPVSGPLALCYWVSREVNSLFCAAQISEYDWEADVGNIMAPDGPTPEQIADDLLQRLSEEAEPKPPPGSMPIFRVKLIEWIQQNRAAGA
jgi:hypothetical protein